MGLPSCGGGSEITLEAAECGERRGESPRGSKKLGVDLSLSWPPPENRPTGGFGFSRRQKEGPGCSLGWSHERSRILAEISYSDCGTELFLLKPFE